MKIFSYNISLKTESKVDIIFFDKNFAKLKIKNFSYRYFDYKKINLLILLKSLPEFFKIQNNTPLKYLYLKKFLEAVDPSVVVGHNYNSVVYKIKKINLNIKTIIYLHNRLYFDQIKKLRKKYVKMKSDFFFLFVTISIKKNYPILFLANLLLMVWQKIMKLR